MTSNIPSDFPREIAGAVPGAQPKLLVRKEGDRYVSEGNEEERAERYGICVDMVEQLAPRAQRYHGAHPDWGREGVQERLHAAIRAKGWDFTEAEIQWIVRNACLTL